MKQKVEEQPVSKEGNKSCGKSGETCGTKTRKAK